MLTQAIKRSPLEADPGDLAYIQSTVEHYRVQIIGHPLARVFSRGRAPLALLKEFASLQYIDSVMWLPMLALAKDRVRNVRLKYILSEDLLQTSHVELCRLFIESLGIESSNRPNEIISSVPTLSEAQVAGWILVSETLVPSLLLAALPAFSSIAELDVTYLRSRILADAGEFSDWILASIEEILVSGADLSEVLEGIHLGGRAALSAPDSLYSKYIRSFYR
jgi:hypothetical protein